MQIIIAGLKSFFEKVSNHPEIFSKFATAVLENIQNMKRENFALISLRNSLREFTLCVFIRADLLDEIAFMKKLGCHKHLVNMIHHRTLRTWRFAETASPIENENEKCDSIFSFFPFIYNRPLEIVSDFSDRKRLTRFFLK
jgi:hypothetical protein